MNASRSDTSLLRWLKVFGVTALAAFMSMADGTAMGQVPTTEPASTTNQQVSVPLVVPFRELPSITVQGQRDVLADSDRRLAQLKNGLPMLGTDSPRHTDFVERAGNYYQAHRDPNTLDKWQQDLLLHLIGAQDQGGFP